LTLSAFKAKIDQKKHKLTKKGDPGSMSKTKPLKFIFFLAILMFFAAGCSGLNNNAAKTLDATATISNAVMQQIKDAYLAGNISKDQFFDLKAIATKVYNAYNTSQVILELYVETVSINGEMVTKEEVDAANAAYIEAYTLLIGKASEYGLTVIQHIKETINAGIPDCRSRDRPASRKRAYPIRHIAHGNTSPWQLHPG